MKAISIRAPWWWAILYCGKDIENREWPTRFRGTVLIHASKWWSLRGVKEDAENAMHCRDASSFHGVIPEEPTYRQMRDLGGHIVGKVDIVDCVTQSASPWFFGSYGFVLANPVAFRNPLPIKGALGFFDVTEVGEREVIQ